METLDENGNEEPLFQDNGQDTGADSVNTDNNEKPDEIVLKLKKNDVVTFNFSKIEDCSMIIEDGLADTDAGYENNLEFLVGSMLTAKVLLDVKTYDYTKIKVVIPKGENKCSNYLILKVRKESLSRSVVKLQTFEHIENTVLESIRLYKESNPKLSQFETRKQEIEALAESIYVKDWDLHEVELDAFTPDGRQTRESIENGDFKYSLVLFFPDTDITNSNNVEHNIKDLYVSLFFDKDLNLSSSSIFGARGLISYEEMRAEYRHSHLSGSNNWGWSRFCIGGGDTEMSTALMGLGTDMYDIEGLEKVLILLLGFVAWESLEGTPYMNIRNISGGGNLSREMSISTEDKKSAYDAFIRTNTDFPAKVNSTNGANRFLVDNENPYIVNALKSCTSKLVVKKPNGEYITRGTSSDSESDIQRFNEDSMSGSKEKVYQIKFKDEWISTMCLAPEKKEEDENVIVPHPNITEYVANELTRRLNDYKLKALEYEPSR